MNLVPARPPGPNARKARAFAAEIAQLRAQGYTFEAIREALAGAGVHVSNSTVQREAARAAAEGRPSAPAQASHEVRRQIQAPPATSAAARVRPTASAAATAPAADRPGDRGATGVRAFDGKQDAEAFFATHDINPLTRSKETS